MRKIIIVSLFILSQSLFAANQNFADLPKVKQFINDMATQYQFNTKQLTILFNHVIPQQETIKHANNPARKKTWEDYRAIFITPARINDGVRFWQQHAYALHRAKKIYGVSPSVIVAIIGIESDYGKKLGTFRAIDALATMAFLHTYQPQYFRDQLAQFLLYCREQRISPLRVVSSYDGGVGLPQFMPSSIRIYAVSFNPGKYANLQNNANDAIMSIANYLSSHGWQDDMPIVVTARVTGNCYKELPPQTHIPEISVKKYRDFCVLPNYWLPPQTPATFINLPDAQTEKYWLGLQNYFVISMYNGSVKYALVVNELSHQIATEYLKQLHKSK